MDSFLGIGLFSLTVFGQSFDWEDGYLQLHKKILSAAAAAATVLPSTVNNIAINSGGSSSSSAAGQHGRMESTPVERVDVESTPFIEK